MRRPHRRQPSITMRPKNKSSVRHQKNLGKALRLHARECAGIYALHSQNSNQSERIAMSQAALASTHVSLGNTSIIQCQKRFLLSVGSKSTHLLAVWNDTRIIEHNRHAALTHKFKLFAVSPTVQILCVPCHRLHSFPSGLPCAAKFHFASICFLESPPP